MPKFLICFRVEQLLSGCIEVYADSAKAAQEAFERGAYDKASSACPVGRLKTKLDLEDSEDSIAAIQSMEDGE